MNLIYDGKKEESEILAQILPAKLNSKWNSVPNKLIQGENLGVLKYLLETRNLASKIDLIYIDPPFATGKIFSIGETRANSISRSLTDKIAYSDNLSGAQFLDFLRERLIFLRELMSDKSSIYLHTDYKIGHYVKILMDEIFGSENFRSDIARIKCNPKNFKRNSYGNIKDVILFYSKGKNAVWNEPRDEFSQSEIKKLFKKTDANGRLYTTIPLHAPGETKRGKTGNVWRGNFPPSGRHWRTAPEELEKLAEKGLIEWSKRGIPRRKIYADEQTGKKKQDIWEYKDAQFPVYPTEKNLEMLKMIIKASSNEGDLVLDCFCGSGTTLFAASELGRKWIGIDQSAEAIKAAKKKLENSEFQFLRQKVL